MRRNPDKLRQKLMAPQEELSGSFMPPYAHLSDREIDGLVAFLSSLTQERQSPDNTGTALIEIPSDDEGNLRFKMAQIKRGKELIFNNGCIVCHRINGIAQGGAVGPNLTHESLRRRSDEWQRRHLIDPVSVYMGGELLEAETWMMPSFGQLPQDELEALVAFLQSLI